MNLSDPNLKTKLAQHIVNTVYGIKITGPNDFIETDKYEIFVNLQSDHSFPYTIKIAEYVWTAEGPIFTYFISNS